MQILTVVVQMAFLALATQIALDRYGGPLATPGDLWAKVHWPTVALVATTLASLVHIGQTLFRFLLAFASVIIFCSSFLLATAYVFSGEDVRALLAMAIKRAVGA